MIDLKKHLLISISLLILTIFVSQITHIDIEVQRYFYDNELKSWLLGTDNTVLKFIFYDGIKKLLIFFVLILVLSLVVFYKSPKMQAYKKGIIIVFLSAILVPLVSNSLKKITKMPCPKNITVFDGKHPNIGLFEKYPDSFKDEEKINCWPAGHASGGFALLSLFFLFKTRKNQIISIFTALGLGWSMGTYKMLIGDHFLSHTIITMLIAWIIIIVLNRIISFENYKSKKDKNVIIKKVS